MPMVARLFIAFIGLGGLAAMAVVFRGWTPRAEPRFIVYLFLALASSAMKIALPGVQGTISSSFVLTMLSLVELTTPEALFLTEASMLVQTCWHAKTRVKAVHLLFNSTCIGLAFTTAAWVFHRPWFIDFREGEILRLALAGLAYFLVNYIPLGIVIALTEGQDIRTVIRRFCDWSFVYYLAGVSVAEIVHRSAENWDGFSPCRCCPRCI
jgi:hypothetical protein